MKLSEELTWRGFANQTTYPDITVLDQNPISFYFGVDPSADSMQVGNLAAVMMVRHFIKAGHKPYILVGGATGIIGDPDGKKDELVMKSLETIATNKAAIVQQYQRAFHDVDFTVVDNYDWFKDITYLDFLRTIGKNVPLSQMLGREFVQSRLGEGGSGISYAEFSYALIQGYDFLHLYRNYGVTLQLCGADQWGNSIAGVDLIRRLDAGEAHVWSLPLIINKATGKKFGKSEDGAVWLDPLKTSPYKFYQFWLNTDDSGVIDYLKIYTILDKSVIDDLAQAVANNPAARQAQKVLAQEVTTFVHGIDKTTSVQKVTAVLFGETPVSQLSAEELAMLANEIPTVKSGSSTVEALVRAGFAGSNGAARRLIDSGAVSINGQKATDDQILSQPALVRKGKNSFLLVW